MGIWFKGKSGKPPELATEFSVTLGYGPEWGVSQGVVIDGDVYRLEGQPPAAHIVTPGGF
jgi:hypothetical protein